MEPCWSFEIHRNRETKKLELESRYRKCLFLYQYWMHPEFGFMNARIQTWFPFPIQICLNGREWLGRQMDREGIKYAAAGNCFPWIEDWAKGATADGPAAAEPNGRRNWNPIAQTTEPCS